MRFYMLSDLHVGESKDVEGSKKKLGKLCAEIRTNPWHDDTVLFVVMGDIINAGVGAAFEDARECLDYILSELCEYDVRFEFLPGNHDVLDGDICSFDAFISQYHCLHNYEISGAYSAVYDDVNLIFADSNLNRDYDKPGLLDLEAIRSEIKKDKQNILFCHHGITHDFGGDHDTVNDGNAVKTELRNMGTRFVFHGHTHRSCTSIQDEICEFGCGAYLKDISDMEGIYNQFMVGYIRDGKIVSVERWIDVSDGNKGFVAEKLFPEKRRFADPNTIGKLQYPPAREPYITRNVIPHTIAIGDIYERVFSDSKKLPLIDVIRKNNRILLLSDAGNGKTVELQNLASILYETELFPFLFLLRNYTGGPISELITDEYNDLPPRRRVLILDGYDELTPDVRIEFEKQLRTYLADNDMVHILISARSNFCKAEMGNKSRTLDGFDIYDLCELTYEDIVSHLRAHGIDSHAFFEELSAKGLIELKSNPFYLEKLIKLFSNKKSLPVKSKLMDVLIEDSFEIDDKKFSGSIDSRYSEMFHILEKLSFAMQLMQKYVFDDRQEYQKLFSIKELALAKHSGLLTHVGASWQFIHNNFREYLAARYLAKLPEEQATPYFSSGNEIKPSWVNTLGYLTGLKIEWDLKGWLAEHSPNALVKFESDRIERDTRYQVLKNIFDKYEEKMLWFHDELCDERELARFSCSPKSLAFLLDKILHPVHHISQYTALQLLRHFPTLYDRREEVLACLMKCCERFPVTRGDTCRLAINAICKLQLNNVLITKKLFRTFAKCDNDYVRLGMYEYLSATEEQDGYVSYFLEGIQYIKFTLGRDTNRIGNEAFALVEGLKKMSSSQSIYEVFEWFATEKAKDFHDADKVFEFLSARAAGLYSNGETNLYDVIMRCLQRAAKTYNHNMEQSSVSFFEKTGTLSQAAIDLAKAFAEDCVSLYEFFSLAPSSIEFIARAYQEDRLSNPEIFHNIVRSCITDETQYAKFAKLIMKKDGVDLPKLQRPQYVDKRRRAEQQYFDMLFNQCKAEEMLTELLSSLKKPNLTIKELSEADIHFELYSPLFDLWLAMRRYASSNMLAVEFFRSICWPSFILQEAKKMLEESKDISPNAEQKESLSQIIMDMVDENIFVDAVKYNTDSASVSTLVVAVLFMIRYLDYKLDMENLLRLTELPFFCFGGDDTTSKYVFLESNIRQQELQKRIIENIEAEKANGVVLRDHLEFCKENNCDAAVKKALEICQYSGKDSSLRRTALEYLYEVLGVEYISEFVLPYADGEFLTEIADLCKELSREKLRQAMEIQYKIAPTESLLAHLITLGSAFALEIYVLDVEGKCCVPENSYYHEGPTEAIRAIHDVELLPFLGRLLNVIFNPNFGDMEIRGLNFSLREALINCGKKNPAPVIDEIKTHLKKDETVENTIWFCNYVIEEIERNKRKNSDQPWTLAKVACLFGG